MAESVLICEYFLFFFVEGCILPTKFWASVCTLDMSRMKHQDLAFTVYRDEELSADDFSPRIAYIMTLIILAKCRTKCDDQVKNENWSPCTRVQEYV